MALALYRRHRLACEGGHAEDLDGVDADEVGDDEINARQFSRREARFIA